MAPREKRQNPIREQLAKAAAMDRRRQIQIENQKASLTRLVAAMMGRATPDENNTAAEPHVEEISMLHEQLAAAQYSVEVLTAELDELRKLPGANDTGGTERA